MLVSGYGKAGYSVPADWAAVLLDEYNDDTNKVHEILWKSKEEIVVEVQKSLITDMKYARASLEIKMHMKL